MIRPVVGTIASRIAIAVMNLLVVVATGQALGAEGLGTVSLVLLAVTIILLPMHVIGGGGLVYLVPRFGIRPLLGPSYGWLLACAAIALLIQQFTPLVPKELVTHVVGLSFLQGMNSIHLNVLLGQERIAQTNRIVVGQAAVQLACYTALLASGTSEVMDYVTAAYIAHGTTVIWSGLSVLRGAASTVTPIAGSWKALFRQGGFAQGANVLQLMNYRLAYYLIEHFSGRAALGVYSVGTQLAESTWLVPRSIGGVLYSKMSNLEEAQRQKDLTVILFKASVIIAACCCLVLVLIPDPVYAWIFGPEVTGLRPILVRLVPGLIAMSASQILSHFLSGTGRIKHNTIGSGLGLITTLVVGFLLIPAQGPDGAAVTASLAYSVSVLYQLIVFLKVTGTGHRELLPHQGDREQLQRVWQRFQQRIRDARS